MSDGVRELPYLTCSTDKRVRLTELVKAYFDLLKNGCGEAATCSNVHCKASGAYAHGDAEDQTLYAQSKTLARDAFRESPVYHFCAAHCYPLPAVARRIASLNDLAPLLEDGATPESLSETFDETFYLQTFGDINAAEWLFFDTHLLREGFDIYEEGEESAWEKPLLSYNNSFFGGGSLCLDLPKIRKIFRKLDGYPPFQNAMQKLVKELKGKSVVAKRESEETMSIDSPPLSPWRAIFDAELSEINDPTQFSKLSKRKYLNSFKLLRITRLCAILLECPYVVNTHTVLTDVATAIGRLHHYISNPLVSVYAHYPPGRLQVIVQALQSFITLTLLQEDQLLRTDPRFNTYIPAACIALSILCEANYMPEQPILSHHAFYNDGINENIDAKLDFDEHYKNEAGIRNLYEAPPSTTLEKTTLQASLLFPSGTYRSKHRDLPERFTVSCFPFLLDAAFKHSLLQHHSLFQQEQEMRRTIFSNPGMHTQFTAAALFLVLKIDRHDLLVSTIREMNRSQDKLRRPLRVEFKGEEGIDEGGVKKEFFQLLVRQLVDASYGMFTEDAATNVHWFQPRLICSTNDIEYHLIGKIIGLAIYNQVILDINFPLVAFKKLLNIEPTFEDLKDLDPQLYKSLNILLEHDESGGTVEDIFCRSFVVSHEVFGEVIEVELIPGGKDVMVTGANRRDFVQRYIQYLCTDSIGKNFEEFRNGFFEVCGRQIELLQTFHPAELEKMVVGSSDFDLSDLESSTRYDGYKPEDTVIKNFWETVRGMGLEEQRMFLKFSTGTDRLPIRGLKSLGFVIGRNGGDSDQLPTAHTCFNHLLLPDYSSAETLKEKLLTAIRNCQGFGLM